MNSIEQQLVRDIAIVTGGVVVTDSDLRVAREAVAERVDRKQRYRRPVLAAAAAALVLVAGVAFALMRDGEATSAPPANPGPTQTTNELVENFLVGSPPTAEVLNGFWRLDNEGTLVRFAAPDAISFDTAGQILHSPGVSGTYELSGDLITVSVDGGTAGCAGQQFAMRASVPEPGVLRLVHTQPGEGTCGERQDAPWTLEKVLPAGPGMASLVLSNERGFEPIADRELLHGFWMAEGGAYALEMDPSGGYYVLNERADVVDGGQWSVRGSRLTLTSSADSTVCTEGDRLVLGSVEQVNPGTQVMRATVREDTCHADWATAVWILIPDERNR